jgi:outer membrane protein, heavy metal efflux system
VDFTSLLDAQRQTRRARLELLKAQADAQMRAAEIERILGEAL